MQLESAMVSPECRVCWETVCQTPSKAGLGVIGAIYIYICLGAGAGAGAGATL